VPVVVSAVDFVVALAATDLLIAGAIVEGVASRSP
jgi:hypothetical protein